MTNLVANAIQAMPQTRRGPSASIPSEVPVRPPRERSLVRSFLQGDALKADVRRFFKVRRESIPGSWDPELIVSIEQILSRDPGSRPGGFLGLLRFSCDLHEQEVGQFAWSEARLWSLVRRRLSSSSGLMLLRSVANAHDILQSLTDDSDPQRRRGFSDLLRILGARTGQPYLEHPRTIDRSIWEFALILSVRCDQFNAELRGTGARPLRCADILFGATSVFLQERGVEPALPDLRPAVLQTGAPLGPALDLWARTLAKTPGQSLLPGLAFPDDPRDWVWETGRSMVEQDVLLDRAGLLASCERALLERARTQESWKEDLALAVHEEFRREIERILPESRRMAAISPVEPILAQAAFHSIAGISSPASVEQSVKPAGASSEVQAAIAAFDHVFVPSETVEGLPTVGFGMLDLERQGRWITEGWRTGWTPTGHVWTDHFRSLLGDARVREFLRLDPDWLGGLRDLLTEPDPWLMAGWEDLVRWLYPAKTRNEPLEFRQNNRHGAPGNRTGWDWTVLRLFALTLSEVASSTSEPGMAPSCLVVAKRWQQMSRARDIQSHTPEWWIWLTDEVETRAELDGRRRFPPVAFVDDAWKSLHVAPWIAVPSPDSASVLGEWVNDPVSSLQTDPHPIHERWASRLSMLTQLQEDAKEDALTELAARV